LNFNNRVRLYPQIEYSTFFIGEIAITAKTFTFRSGEFSLDIQEVTSFS